MNPNVEKMTPFIVMDILERANALQAQGIDVIHLEVGEPDFDIPPTVARAAKASCDKGKTHYTHSMGDPELRQQIAVLYFKEYGVKVDPDCILMTSGSSPAILMYLMVLCEAGSEVLIPNPGYACYSNFTLAVNAKPVFVDILPENKFQYTLDDVRSKITDKTRAIFVNSPMNPTGGLIEPDLLESLTKQNIPIISDEIYHGLVYEGKAHSVLEYTDQAFVLNGFSKRFAMTGLRLGYLIAPKKYMRALQILQQNLFICASSPAQRAGIAALSGGADKEVAKMKNVYDERRKYMLARLPAMGFVIHSEPKGAFYIFADARRFTHDCYRFAFDVLEHAHVGIT